ELVMSNRTLRSRALALLGFSALAACTARASNGTGSTSGALNCEDFRASGNIDANLDANVKVFLEATRELRTVTADVHASVKKACIGVAADLGAKDTWSAHGDDDASIHADDGTGACDVAIAHIRNIMEAHADANFALVITRGHCREDFEEIKRCDQKCSKE